MHKNLTIRGPVVYVLAIAEHIINDLKSNIQGYLFAKEAIQSGWKWQDNFSVNAYSLNKYLMNKNEEGLLIYEQQTPDNKRYAWMTITSTIAYVTWHAYQQKGEFIPRYFM
jgi:hypothetical protein